MTTPVSLGETSRYIGDVMSWIERDHASDVDNLSATLGQIVLAIMRKRVDHTDLACEPDTARNQNALHFRISKQGPWYAVRFEPGQKAFELWDSDGKGFSAANAQASFPVGTSFATIWSAIDNLK